MIVVIDDFIKDQTLLDNISNDDSFFQDPGVYYWWDGWWNSQVNTTKKELIQYIWANNVPITATYDLSGFEYWTGIQTHNTETGHDNKLDIHFDKDESLFENTGKISTPMIGTVYYPEQDEFEGGMLLIYTNGVDNPPETIYAKANRLIIFDAGEVVHAVSTVTKGIRKAIAINLWESEPFEKQNGNMAIEQ